jgi:D-alanine-D-alanine ligase
VDELKEKMLLALDYDNRVIVEEYIKGTEITCPVLGAFAGEEPSALPLVEIIPPDSAVFFDYDVKYNGSTRKLRLQGSLKILP